ncbi:MAG: phospho-sugar mutase [Fuerstiella sp.]|nr:phospho-sugar mutase [Fuerstiella sp.]MCP4510498.1 phospho-sugar mutase [Fuerstiella sp.]
MPSETVSRIEQANAGGNLTTATVQNIKVWLSKDCMRPYHARIVEMINSEEWSRLDELFWTAIPFGTGGRRGPMGELGPASINDRTIAESAHGLACYLRESGVTEGGSAVVTCDTRNKSMHFARLTATTFAAHGLKVYLFESHRATPALSFAVRKLGCHIGVMISASHNPPADNGFKAYWSNGGQVIPPHDKGIIAQVENADLIPSIDYSDAIATGGIEVIGATLDSQYVDEVAALCRSSSRDISAVFTPLHGVGETSIYRILQHVGFDKVDIFEDHRKPDGDFPNVPDHLPNPELLEVFDPVIDWVRETSHDADLILASDPDADRLGVMVRNREGGFTAITGNQTGALITDYLLSKRRDAGTLSADDYVVETLVTTPLVKCVAAEYGARTFNELLVGFKWIAQTIEENGADHFVFGCEESIGFLSGGYCRDKDGAVGALFILELAAELKAAGKTLLDHLDTLYSRHGYHAEGQKSIYCTGPTGKAKIDGLMQTLRENPPAEFGPVRFVEVADYAAGKRTGIPGGDSLGTIDEPVGDLLIYKSDPDSSVRVQIAGRPSGTEPKIKFYFFCQTDLSDGGNLEHARAAGDGVMNEVQEALAAWADEKLAD